MHDAGLVQNIYALDHLLRVLHNVLGTGHALVYAIVEALLDVLHHHLV